MMSAPFARGGELLREIILIFQYFFSVSRLRLHSTLCCSYKLHPDGAGEGDELNVKGRATILHLSGAVRASAGLSTGLFLAFVSPCMRVCVRVCVVTRPCRGHLMRFVVLDLDLHL